MPLYIVLIRVDRSAYGFPFSNLWSLLDTLRSSLKTFCVETQMGIMSPKAEQKWSHTLTFFT